MAATVELHYTSTLDNANVITLPQDTNSNPNIAKAYGVVLPSTFTGPANGVLGVPTPSQVGNLNNRLDIIDMTVGTTFEINNQLTVATGVSFPLRGGADKTYDWEFQLQLNYYWGRTSR